MNNSFIFTNLFVLLLFSIIGCENYKKELNHIKKTENLLNSIESNYISIDTSSIGNIVNKYERLLIKIKKINHKDFSKNELNLINQLYDYRKANDFFKKNISTINKKINVSKSQLKYLTLDIKNNNIKPQEFYQFLEIEKKQIISINKDVQKLNDITNIFFGTIKNLNSKIDSLFSSKK